MPVVIKLVQKRKKEKESEIYMYMYIIYIYIVSLKLVDLSNGLKHLLKSTRFPNLAFSL